MATKYKTKAFVFKKENRNESDRQFSLFTDEFGRIDITARAIRKTTSKLRSGIDIFSISEVEFIQGRTKKTLTDASIIKRFNNIYSNTDKLLTAGNIAEVTDSLIRGQEKDREIYKVLCDAFYVLNNDAIEAKKCSRVYYYFLWSLMSVLGYRPEVEKCNDCQKKLDQDYIYFSNKSGGAICGDCARDYVECRKINSDVIKILRIIFSRDWETMSKLRVDISSKNMFKDISDSYYSYISADNLIKNNSALVKFI